MNNGRKIAIDILTEVLQKNAYSNIVMNNKLNNCNLNKKDRALVTEIVYGTLKYKYTIDKILDYYLKSGIKKLDSIVANILRTSVYQIRYLDKIPDFAVVNEAVELTKKKKYSASKLVNGVLRNYLRNKEVNYYNEKDNVEKLCFQYSFPKWIVKLFMKQYEYDLIQKILQGLNEVPYVTVRVNNLKGEYEEVYNKLIEYGYKIEEGSVCPEAIKIIKGRNVADNKLFKEGFITVQDESAMLVAPSMDVTSEIKVFDLCSAPGGKATHIAEIMGNSGQVLAFDIYKNKLNLIKQNTKRLGIHNIACKVLDATEYNKNLINKADRVLIDVPCSGLGIIRKKPEIKWTKDLKSIDKLIDIQRSIMVNASKYIKQGGVLLYSTCTLNKKENEQNIKWFIKKYPQFSIEPVYYGNLDNIIYHKEGFVTILPNKYMDGFFIAKLKKHW